MSGLKKVLLVLSIISFSTSAIPGANNANTLPPEVRDSMYCVGYTQAIYENTALNTSVNTEAEAAMQYFYMRSFNLQEDYKIDDGDVEGAKGKDSEALNWAFSLGYAQYLHDKKPMPEMCIKPYSEYLKSLSTKQVLEPYNK